MPLIVERLEQDIKQAAVQRGGDLATLRMLKAALHNEAIACRGRGQILTAADEITVVRRELKRRQEAAKIYETNNRPELARQEQFEAGILQRYLPPLPTSADISATAARLQQELGLSGQAAAGQLIKAVLAYYQGAVDGQTVSGVVRELLSRK